MKKTASLLIIAFIFFLAACSLAPHYERPESPAPPDWPSGAAYEAANKEDSSSPPPAVSQLPWRDFIADERLQEIIAAALQNNRDLRIASLNVELTRALYGVSRASILPSLDAAGGWYKERTPADLSASGAASTVEKYSVNLGVTAWEVDFFGRIRSLKDKALEEYLASWQAWRSYQIMLVTATTEAYLVLAADREALDLVSKTLEGQKESYELIRKLHDAGIVSELDLRRAQSQVETARREVARYTQLSAQNENALQLLVGSPLRQDLLPPNLSSIKALPNISPGLSSEILLQRPDVMAAEHKLKASNANIGAARAAFLPRISLTAAFGVASSELSGLFKAGSDTWMFSPQIVMPVFDVRTWFAYDATKIEKEMMIAQYEKTIQVAFQETADALAEKVMIQQRIAAQQALVDALSEAYRLCGLRYSKGVDTYLAVLDAQRSLYADQQVLIALRLAQLCNLARLYKVLGGSADKTATADYATEYSAKKKNALPELAN